MNANNFTQKSLEALQSAQTVAQRHGNQQMEQVHLCANAIRNGHNDTAFLGRPQAARVLPTGWRRLLGAFA